MELNKFMVDSGVESNIIIGFVVSKAFLQSVRHAYRPEYMRTSYGVLVSKWCMDYFDAYNDVPNKYIQQIYEDQKPNMSETDASLIAIFLQKLSVSYSSEKTYNADYHVTQALGFFKERELEIRAKNTLALLQAKRLRDAEEEFIGYKGVSKKTALWFDPFSNKEVLESFESEDDRVLKVHGPLGDLLKGFELGWTVMLPGGYKRGKTWWLQEFAIMAITQNLPTVIISLEMTKKKVKERMYKRLTGWGEEEEFVIPIFDCVHNQKGECGKPERIGDEPLIDPETKTKPEFTPDLPYVACDFCRRQGSFDYKMATWWTVYRPSGRYEMSQVSGYMDRFNQYYGSMTRVICYPRFSVKVSEVIHDLDMLEYSEGFVPKVICWDYPEITKPDKFSGSDWQDINGIWMRVASLSQQRNCIVFAPSQITTDGLEEHTLTQKNIGRARQVLGHVDASISVNQMKEERQRGISRLSIMVHRHQVFDESRQCVALQHLTTGQVELDTELITIGQR